MQAAERQRGAKRLVERCAGQFLPAPFQATSYVMTTLLAHLPPGPPPVTEPDLPAHGEPKPPPMGDPPSDPLDPIEPVPGREPPENPAPVDKGRQLKGRQE